MSGAEIKKLTTFMADVNAILQNSQDFSYLYNNVIISGINKFNFSVGLFEPTTIARSGFTLPIDGFKGLDALIYYFMYGIDIEKFADASDNNNPTTIYQVAKNFANFIICVLAGLACLSASIKKIQTALAGKSVECRGWSGEKEDFPQVPAADGSGMFCIDVTTPKLITEFYWFFPVDTNFVFYHDIDTNEFVNSTKGITCTKVYDGSGRTPATAKMTMIDWAKKSIEEAKQIKE